MSKGILDTISGLFGGHKDGQTATATQEHGVLDSIENIVSGSGIGKELLSKLGDIQSFDPSQIQSVLGALSGSADTKVQGVKQDLETVQSNGTDFVSKLKGYLTSMPQLLQTLLPVLQGILGQKK